MPAPRADGIEPFLGALSHNLVVGGQSQHAGAGFDVTHPFPDSAGFFGAPVPVPRVIPSKAVWHRVNRDRDGPSIIDLGQSRDEARRIAANVPSCRSCCACGAIVLLQMDCSR